MALAGLALDPGEGGNQEGITQTNDFEHNHRNKDILVLTPLRMDGDNRYKVVVVIGTIVGYYGF